VSRLAAETEGEKEPQMTQKTQMKKQNNFVL